MSLYAKAGQPVADAAPFAVSVIVPTYNRPDALLTCLRHLERQTFTDFEVLVVDDGSVDRTPELVAEYARTTPLSLRSLRQANAGPARARNYAIREANAPIVLMIGDDIFAEPELVARHLAAHQEHPAENVVALGLTEWDEDGQTVTPFMRWLTDSGMQFSYGDLQAGAAPDWRHFYTSNLSAKTSLLREQRFDEGFPKASMEDIELGYRIDRACGLEMIFLPEARARHLHPTSFTQACRRLVGVGESAFRFHQLWPEQRPPQAKPGPRAALVSLLHRKFWLFAPLVWLADRATRLRCPNPLMIAVLRLHTSQGYRRAAAADRNHASNPAEGGM